MKTGAEYLLRWKEASCGNLNGKRHRKAAVAVRRISKPKHTSMQPTCHPGSVPLIHTELPLSSAGVFFELRLGIIRLIWRSSSPCCIFQFIHSSWIRTGCQKVLRQLCKSHPLDLQNLDYFFPCVLCISSKHHLGKKCFWQPASKHHHTCKSEKYMKAAYLLDNETSLAN